MNSIRKWVYYLKSIFTLLFGFKNWLEVLRIFLGKSKDGTRTLNLKEMGLTFKVRGRMDIWSIKETFLDRFYAKYGTAINPDWTVMDIGAAIGEFTLWAAIQATAGHVIAYEPHPGSFALLEENIAINKVENVRIVNRAVWEKSGMLQLDLSGGEPLQVESLEKLIDDGESGQAQIEALMLEQALAQNNIEILNLLKLDCEGAEFPILLSTGKEILDRIERIVMEYHDGYAGHRHGELVRHLESAGYQVRVTPNLVHAEIGYLYAKR